MRIFFNYFESCGISARRPDSLMFRCQGKLFKLLVIATMRYSGALLLATGLRPFESPAYAAPAAHFHASYANSEKKTDASTGFISIDPYFKLVNAQGVEGDESAHLTAGYDDSADSHAPMPPPSVLSHIHEHHISQSYIETSPAGSILSENLMNLKISFEELKKDFMQSASGSIKGRRDTKEDAVVTLKEVRPRMFFLAVFDGHGGFSTAKYLQEFAAYRILASVPPSSSGLTKFPGKSVEKACLNLDKEIVRNPYITSGSTAAMLFIEWDYPADLFFVQAISIGDSRAMLIYPDGRFDILTHDHNTSFAGERERVHKAGGFFTTTGNVERVNGVLAMTRAFGDARLKDYTKGDDQPVSAIPTIEQRIIDKTPILLVACDGLFEPPTMTRSVVANLVSSWFTSSSGNLKLVIQKLLYHAYIEGSGDNISLTLAVINFANKSSNFYNSFSL